MHVFWKTLSMDGSTWNVGDDEGKRRVARSLMNDFIDNEFPNLSADEQHRFTTIVRQIARPELAVVEEPL